LILGHTVAVEETLAARATVCCHSYPERSHFGCRGECRPDVAFPSYVGPDEGRAVPEFFGNCTPFLFIEVADDHLCAGRVQTSGGRGSEATSAACDEGGVTSELHDFPFVRVPETDLGHDSSSVSNDAFLDGAGDKRAVERVDSSLAEGSAFPCPWGVLLVKHPFVGSCR